MNASLRPARFLCLFLSLSITPHLALAQTTAVRAPAAATGSIEGRIFNAATGAALSRARVVIEGSNSETTTDDYGAFRLAAPIGDAHVIVTFIGMETQSATVSVSAGVVSQKDFDLKTKTDGDAIVSLDTYVVVAAREFSAQAVAQNERKNAANIRQVVAFDEFGDRGAENIGELMRFLPGVGIIDGGQTASTIALRGFPDSNTALQIDGAELASARGNSRTQSLLDVSMANISRVEVNKVPVPDQPASGMGGSINIITRNGFEARNPAFSFKTYLLTDSYSGLTFDGGPRGPTDKLSPKYQQPSFDFSYLLPVNKKFALSFGGSRSWRLKPMERDDHLDTQADWNFIGGFQRLSTWLSLSNVIQTWSAQVGADWKLSERDTLSAGFEHRYVSNNIMRLSYVATYGAGATGDATFTQGAATAVGSVAQGAGTNQETGADTTHFTLKYSHRGNNWRVESLGALSRSESFLNDIDNGHFNSATSSITGLILRGEGTGEDDAHIPVRYSATTTAGVPVNIFSGANFVLGNPTSSQNKVIADKRTGKLDFTRDFDAPLPFTLKTGLYVDQQVRDQKTYAKTWTFTPNGLTTNAAKLATNFDVFDSAFNATAPTIFGNQVNWISLPKYYDLFKAHPDWFVLNDALYLQNFTANSRKLAETISAAYIRGDIRLLNDRLLVVGGVRFEQTKDDGQGQLDDPNAQYLKDAAGNLIDGNPSLAGVQPVLITTDTLGRAQLRYKERGTRVIRTYNDFYPSVNLTYNLTKNLLIRGAYSETIARPNLNNIIPGSSIADPTAANLAITVNNTGLKPWFARGLDLSLESYQLSGGYGSIGVFQRNIKDFFNSVTEHATPELLERYGLPNDPVYLNYDITTLTNGSNAKITGFEFAYNQQLLFLPHWARGFQVFVNATQLRLQGGDQADFSAFAPSNYAGGINFIRPRFYVKLSFTYQGETRQTAVAASAANGIPANVYNYQGERLRVGINAQFALTKQLALFGSMTDINGPGFNIVNTQYAPGTPDYMKKRRRQELGSIITLGVKGDF
jgi:TonB-dependent receptor